MLRAINFTQFPPQYFVLEIRPSLLYLDPTRSEFVLLSLSLGTAIFVPSSIVLFHFQSFLAFFHLKCLCMAANLLACEVSDLCLGKPSLRSISISATVADALSVLTRIDEGYISVWSCGDHSSFKEDLDLHCRCVGKVCMVDIICFLCRQENLLQPAIALRSPISVLIPEGLGLVRHLEPHARFES